MLARREPAFFIRQRWMGREFATFKQHSPGISCPYHVPCVPDVSAFAVCAYLSIVR